MTNEKILEYNSEDIDRTKPIYYTSDYHSNGNSAIGCALEIKDRGLGKVIRVLDKNKCELEFLDGEKAVLKGCGPRDFYKYYESKKGQVEIIKKSLEKKVSS